MILFIAILYALSTSFAALLETSTNPQATVGSILRAALLGPVVSAQFLWMCVRR